MGEVLTFEKNGADDIRFARMWYILFGSGKNSHYGPGKISQM